MWSAGGKSANQQLFTLFCTFVLQPMHCNVALFVIYSISRLTLLQSPPSLSLHFYLKDGRDGQNKFIWLWIFLLHIGERRVISLNWELEGVGDSSSALTQALYKCVTFRSAQSTNPYKGQPTIPMSKDFLDLVPVHDQGRLYISCTGWVFYWSAFKNECQIT